MTEHENTPVASLAAEERRLVERKLKELQQKHSERRSALRDLQSFHSAAWAQYGSELSSGGMMREEREVSADIEALAANIALLTNCLSGEVPVRRDLVAAGELEYKLVQRQKLDAEIVALQQKLAVTDRVRALLVLPVEK